MSKNKKKAPGRPRKEFVSRKSKTKIKSGPGRPRKYQKDIVKNIVHNTTKELSSTELSSFVEKSVDDSKKKDLIILVLFLLSFVLFVISLYFTFMRDKKREQLSQIQVGQIANIKTGNIDYNTEDPQVPPIITESVQQQPILQPVSVEHQIILNFYQAINTVDMDTIYRFTDSRLEESNVFKTYYNKRRLSRFSEMILEPKIIISNIEEKEITENPNIKHFTYTLEYTLTKTQQKYTEERSTVLIKRGDNRKIGKLMCETKGCSTMPFFNTDKYK